jgi:initiation factor 1A
MVKNTTGGSKTKGQARKLVADKSKISKFLRMAQEEGEVYAKVEKLLGNGMCHVLCLDKVTRLCFIRGKFRGRGKKDNLLTMGTWVLVGLREWENNTTSSAMDSKPTQKCDLLEVYNDMDKERLKSTVHEDWNIFQDERLLNKIEGDIEFTDEKTGEYIELIEKELNKKKTEKIINIVQMEEEINIDDI